MDYLINLTGDILSVSEVSMVVNSLYLIVSLPIVTTITGIFRHIIGMKSLSIYAPIVLTFTFYKLSYLDFTDLNSSSYMHGIQLGFILYFTVFAFSTSSYFLLKKMRMHYIPKATLITTVVSIAVMFLIFLGVLTSNKSLILLDFFPILMIITLSNIFVSTFSRTNFERTLIICLQTLLISIISYTIISLDFIKDFTMNYTLLVVFGIVVINIYVGRFTGLRLTEYYRFRYLLSSKPDDQSNKQHK